MTTPVARPARTAALLTLLLLALGLLTACGSDTPGPSATGDAGAVVVDVRTPQEFASGHLRGAVNLDVSDAGFADAVAALDPDAAYVVYCRSGNRSAAAASLMREAGLQVTDAGAMDAAAQSTGLPVVTG